MELHFYHFYETILFFGDGAASVTIFIRFFRASAAWIYQSPSIGEFLDMMSHDEFVARYEKGDMGCSVSVLFALRLFLAGRIRERRIALNLLLWLSGLLLLIAASVLEFLKLAFVWALLCSAIGLVFYASVFFYSFGGLVLSAALADEDFYKAAMGERALWIYPDDERNLPKLHRK